MQIYLFRRFRESCRVSEFATKTLLPILFVCRATSVYLPYVCNRYLIRRRTVKRNMHCCRYFYFIILFCSAHFHRRFEFWIYRVELQSRRTASALRDTCPVCHVRLEKYSPSSRSREGNGSDDGKIGYHEIVYSRCENTVIILRTFISVSEK